MRFLFIFLISLAAHAQTTLHFQNLTDMNLARGTVACAADNTNFYVANGFSATQNFTSLVEKYDVANNSWSVLTYSLVAKQAASAVVIGTNLYVFNGVTSNGTRNNKMEVVDVTTGSITLSTTNPMPVTAAGTALWNGSIYVFGGSTSTGYSKKLYRFDPSTQTWTPLADMLQAMETVGAVVNGKIYTFGGYNGADLSLVDIYDIVTNTWQHLSTLPFVLSSNSTAVKGNRIYTAFDYTNETMIGYFDITTNTYTALLQSNMIGRRHGGAAIVNNKIYIMAGNTSGAANSCLSSLQVADLEGTTVGIKEETGSSVKLYPNPVSDVLNIEGYSDYSDVSIIDATGKTVMHLAKATGPVDVSQFTGGLYRVKLVTPSGGVLVTTFLKE